MPDVPGPRSYTESMNAYSPSDVSSTTVIWFPVVTLILGFRYKLHDRLE